MNQQRVFESETVWHLALPEIRFGTDSIEDLAYQLGVLGCKTPASGLMITDEQITENGHVDKIREVLSGTGYEIEVFSGGRREPTIDDVEQCISSVSPSGTNFDFYIGLGGGSIMDTTKIVRAVIENGGNVTDYVTEPIGNNKSVTRSDNPLVAIATTLGTPAQNSMAAVVKTGENKKAIISDPEIRPEGVILDPRLTITLPPDLTAQTVMDALGPAIEGYTTAPLRSRKRAVHPKSRQGHAGRTEFSDAFSEKAIHLLHQNVREAVHRGKDLTARTNVMLGGLFGAVAGRLSGTQLCHAMAYAVQNQYQTYHAETVGVLTPAATLGSNVASDPGRYRRVAELMGLNVDNLNDHEAARAAKSEFIQMQRDLEVFPSGLAELADIEEDEVILEELAEHTMESGQRLLRNAPRLITKDQLKETFRNSLYNWTPD